jgi:hypothetical protein
MAKEADNYNIVRVYKLFLTIPHKWNYFYSDELQDSFILNFGNKFGTTIIWSEYIQLRKTE